MKISRLSAILFSALFVSQMTACGQPAAQPVQGEIDSSLLSDSSQSLQDSAASTVSQAGMPVYDYQAAPRAKVLDTTQEKQSIYLEQLSQRGQQAYSQIAQSAKEHKSTVLISRPVTEAVFAKVMNLVMLDSPDLFMLDTVCEYETDRDGNVSSVSLFYVCDAAQQQTWMDAMEKQLTDFCQSLTEGTTENDVEKTLYDSLSAVSTPQILHDTKQSASFSGEPSLKGLNEIHSIAPWLCGKESAASCLGRAKRFAACARRAGLGCSVIVGEFTNPGYLRENGYPIGDYPQNGIVVSSRNGTKKRLRWDLDGLYAWNIVELNGSWYHVDPLFGRIVIQDLESVKEGLSTNLSSLYMALNTNDYITAQSRTFHQSEELLGLVPECSKLDYQGMYAQGKAIVNYNQSQIPIKIESVLSDLCAQQQQEAVFQFCSEQTYDLFLNGLEEGVQSFNEGRTSTIRSYKVRSLRQSLLVYLYDIIAATSQSG